MYIFVVLNEMYVMSVHIDIFTIQYENIKHEFVGAWNLVII